MHFQAELEITLGGLEIDRETGQKRIQIIQNILLGRSVSPRAVQNLIKHFDKVAYVELVLCLGTLPLTILFKHLVEVRLPPDYIPTSVGPMVSCFWCISTFLYWLLLPVVDAGHHAFRSCTAAAAAAVLSYLGSSAAGMF